MWTTTAKCDKTIIVVIVSQKNMQKVRHHNGYALLFLLLQRLWFLTTHWWISHWKSQRTAFMCINQACGEITAHLPWFSAIALRVAEALDEHHEDKTEKDEGCHPPHELIGGNRHSSDQFADHEEHHVPGKRYQGGGVRLGLKGESRHEKLNRAGPQGETNCGGQGMDIREKVVKDKHGYTTLCSPSTRYWEFCGPAFVSQRKNKSFGEHRET